MSARVEGACECDPQDRTLAVVFSRLLCMGGCTRCAALDALHGLAKLEDRTPAGLFLQIARDIGQPDAVLLVGHAWDDLHAALDEVLVRERHTCVEDAA